MNKKKVIKKFEHLPDNLVILLKQKYPEGYEENLISFQSPGGELQMGLPLETDEAYYLIKMPKNTIHTSLDEEEKATHSVESLESLDNLQIVDESTEED